METHSSPFPYPTPSEEEYIFGSWLDYCSDKELAEMYETCMWVDETGNVLSLLIAEMQARDLTLNDLEELL